MAKIIDPRLEIEQTARVLGLTPEDLSRLTGVPKSRIRSAFEGLGVLSLDDIGRCRDILRAQLPAVRTPPSDAPAQPPGARIEGANG